MIENDYSMTRDEAIAKIYDQLSELDNTNEIKEDGTTGAPSLYANIPIVNIKNEMKKEMDNDPNRGITIECFEDTYHLLTKKENHDELTKLFDIKIKNPLTGSMLETLAIIAYNEPITRVEIDEIRGVGSAYLVRKLLLKNLIPL